MRATMWAMAVVAACGGAAPEASGSAEGLAGACSALNVAFESVAQVPDVDKQATAWRRAQEALAGDAAALSRLEELVAAGRAGEGGDYLATRARDPEVALACAPFMGP